MDGEAANETVDALSTAVFSLAELRKAIAPLLGSASNATPASRSTPPSPSRRAISTLGKSEKRSRARHLASRLRPSYSNVELHVHHLRSFGQGGLTEMHNLLTLCHTCHTGLGPDFEFQLLCMVPDGLVAPDAHDTFAEGVRRYPEVVATHLDKLAGESTI